MSAGYRIENIAGLQAQIVSLQNSVAGLDTLALQQTKTSLSSAQILALFTTPQNITMTTPPSGQYNTVFNLVLRLNFVTTAYAVNVTLAFDNGAGSEILLTNATVLTGTTTIIENINLVQSTSLTASQYPSGGRLRVRVLTGNPTLGDGTLDIYTAYRRQVL